MAAKTRSAQYQLVFRPDWSDVERIRQATLLWVEAVLANAEAAERVAIACAELLENAIKHSDRPEGLVQFDVELDGAQIRVRVASPCLRDGVHARSLHEHIRWIQDQASPQEAYVARMQQLFDAGETVEGGLGLVRVVHEAGCALNCTQRDPVTVEVEALFSLTPTRERPLPSQAPKLGALPPQALPKLPASLSSQRLFGVQREDLSVSIDEGEQVCVHFAGVLRERDPESWLLPLLQRARRLAEAAAKPHVVLDFRELSGMGASAFRTVVTFLRELRDERATLKLRVHANSAHLWQGVAMSSLKSLGGEQVEVIRATREPSS